MLRLWCTAVLCFLLISHATGHQFTDVEMAHYRERIKTMFYHAYNSYLEHAYPYDELRPLSCDGQDTWGSFSLTLIDALDTLLILGNQTEFQRVASLLQDTVDFDIDVNASVFETNIRVVGGLLSAHLLSKRAGMEVESGWPCSGPLLRMAEDAARKLLPAFQTATGMPYGTVNLLKGVSPTETPVTCTAGVGTFILEFATLSRLTGDPVFENVARRALTSLWNTRSDIGLVGNHIDVLTKKWVAQDAGIGAGVDSYFEYLVKGAVMLQDQELLSMFQQYDKAIQNYSRFDDWYLWVQMHKGTVSMPVFQSLEAFWPGLQSIVGDLDSAVRTFLNYYSVWRQFGGLPEFYSIPQGYTVDKREGYPLRPELVESAMYLYRATGDQVYLQLGRDVVQSLEKISRVDCGYASVKDMRDHKLDNRMESFFLAETIKYLYLLFDPTNFLLEAGSWEAGEGPSEDCVLGAGGYVFNTEAHPLDPAALHCCSQRPAERQEVRDILLNLTEKPTPTRRSQPERPTPTRPSQSETPVRHSQPESPVPAQDSQSESTISAEDGQSQSVTQDDQSESPTQDSQSGSSTQNGQSESLTQDSQSEDTWLPGASESIAVKPGARRSGRLLSCPMQPFSQRFSVLGQVFSDQS